MLSSKIITSKLIFVEFLGKERNKIFCFFCVFRNTTCFMHCPFLSPFATLIRLNT